MVFDVKIEGKNVLITGGASGLGAAYADAFLKSGAQNVTIFDIAKKVGEDYAEKLNEAYNNKVTFIKCDVSKEEEIKNCFQEALNRMKRIDIIINNAGIMDDSIDAWRIASDVNWQGLVSVTRKGIRHMRKDEGGSGGTIINVSSTAALVQTMDILPVYSGCKAAVLHFSRSLSSPQFYDETGVRILTICLGPTATPLLGNIEQKCFGKVTKQFLLMHENYQYQRVESAVQAMLKMFREGNPGSVWLSNQNEPALDITSVIDEAFTPLLKLLTPLSVTTVSK